MALTPELIESLLIDTDDIISCISEELSITATQIKATLDLFAEDCTVPFIARYRKEKTGNLDETEIRSIEHLNKSLTNLETRRIEIIKGIFLQGLLTEELLANIQLCSTQTELEDIYAPYKRKKKTRGMKAIEADLEGLAELMLTAEESAIIVAANDYLNEEHAILTIEDALQGAMDILAERISQDTENRAKTRDFILKHGQLIITGNKDKETSVYGMYYDYKEPLSTVKPHRVLAMNRGESEKELEIKIDIEEEKVNNVVLSHYSLNNKFHSEAIVDGMKRLLIPAVLREIRSNFTSSADKHGIGLFSANLQNILLQSPIKSTRILAFDPGIRTGTKVVAIDENGKFLEDFMFYQLKDNPQYSALITGMIKKHNINLIAIGNGTGSHDVQEYVSKVIEESKIDIPFTVVAEDGASVYSASPIAKEEFPDLDVSIRGAISIGRRLQDPLAELVKIDPKSIGVGLYQHDLNQSALNDSLDETVESVVNRVGININTASYSLLKYVSGIKISLAKKIVSYRDKNGAFTNRMELLKVTGMGDKTFEQAAGFLKVPNSQEILDNSWVHPENYDVAREILAILSSGKPTKEQKESLMNKYHIGDTTIEDIIVELQKPAHDPREDFPGPIMQKGVKTFEDLRVGMQVTGKIKNVVDFGAFVDLGIKETALIHLSEMSDQYIDHPMDVVKAGDVITAYIIDMDEKRRRIGLSMKSGSGTRNPKVFAQKSEKDSKAPSGNKSKISLKKPAGQQNSKDQIKKNDAGQITHNPFAKLLK
ncbi:MAG: helix-hairpin-helix domain-containing protein [Brevinema sp.]